MTIKQKLNQYLNDQYPDPRSRIQTLDYWLLSQISHHSDLQIESCLWELDQNGCVHHWLCQQIDYQRIYHQYSHSIYTKVVQAELRLGCNRDQLTQRYQSDITQSTTSEELLCWIAIQETAYQLLVAILPN